MQLDCRIYRSSTLFSRRAYRRCSFLCSHRSQVVQYGAANENTDAENTLVNTRTFIDLALGRCVSRHRTPRILPKYEWIHCVLGTYESGRLEHIKTTAHICWWHCYCLYIQSQPRSVCHYCVHATFLSRNSQRGLHHPAAGSMVYRSGRHQVSLLCVNLLEVSWADIGCPDRVVR